MLGGQIVTFGSKIQYGRCNHCTCVRSKDGPLFLCDKLSGCKEARSLPKGSTKTLYGDGAGIVEDQTGSSTFIEKQTKLRTVVREAKPRGCMYRGSLVPFSGKIRIPPCQRCTCVEQGGRHPVFVCKDVCQTERRRTSVRGTPGSKTRYRDTGGRTNKDDNRWGSRKNRFHIDNKHDSNDVHSSRFGNFRHGPPQRVDKDGKPIRPSGTKQSRHTKLFQFSKRPTRTRILEFSKTVDAGVSDGSSTWSSAADKRRNTPVTTSGIQIGYAARPSLGQRNTRDMLNTHSPGYRAYSFGRVRRTRFGRGYVVGEDRGDSVCSYGGITVPVGSRVFISSCKLCKCVQPVSPHGPRLVCFWRKHCVRTAPVPGCHVSGVVVPRNQRYSVGRCTACSCQYGFNGFQASCSRDHQCDSRSRRVSRFAVPTELPVEEYVEPRFKAGCRLNDGNVVMEGDSLLDKGNCRTCHCSRRRLSCERRSCTAVKRAAGCFLGDHQIKQGSHIGRGCKRCTCNGYGVFVCKFDYNCVRRHTRPSLNCFSGGHKVPHGTTANIGCNTCSCRRGQLTCHHRTGCRAGHVTVHKQTAKPAGKVQPKKEKPAKKSKPAKKEEPKRLIKAEEEED